MSDFIKVLLRKNSLRKQCEGLSAAQIEKVIGDLDEIKRELAEQEVRAQEEARQREEKLKALRQMIIESGIDINELVDMGVDGSVRKAVKAKYVITDDEGERHEWTGRGRTPIAFKQYMEARGISKDQLPTVD